MSNQTNSSRTLPVNNGNPPGGDKHNQYKQFHLLCLNILHKYHYFEQFRHSHKYFRHKRHRYYQLLQYYYNTLHQIRPLEDRLPQSIQEPSYNHYSNQYYLFQSRYKLLFLNHTQEA